MSAPMTKSQMAFELPPLSYIDTRWEEPDGSACSRARPQARFRVMDRGPRCSAPDVA